MKQSPPPPADKALYRYDMPGGKHWSLRLRRGMSLALTDLEGGANVGMLFFNPENLLERYNAPDTLKCQHTFKLTRGNCLYSDMGRIFSSIVEDSLGWHETLCGNSTAEQVREKWGGSSYQSDLNDWLLNGRDSFLIEMAKYGLGRRDLAANINFFSRVEADAGGRLGFVGDHSRAGDRVCLRFEMDTLVIAHTCPHPLNAAARYPRRPVRFELRRAPAVGDDDYCRNLRPENRRGFENNRLYHLGLG